MAQEFKNVALVGGTGNLGAPILQALLSSSFDVSVLTRQASTAAFPARVNVLKTDYTEASLVRALQGQDVVICAIGGAGFGEQKTIINAAIKAGVQRFLPSEFSSNTLSEKVRELVPLFQVKMDILEYLRSKETETFGWTALCCGPLLDGGLQSGFLGFDLANHKATIWDDGKKAFSLTNVRAMSHAVVSVLLHPEETRNKYLFVSSTEVTQLKLLELLEQASGGRWDRAIVTTGQQVETGRKMVAQGDFAGMLMLVQASMWGGFAETRADFPVDEKDALASELLGVEKVNLQEVVEGVVQVVGK